MNVSIHWTGRTWLAASAATRHALGTEHETLDACWCAAHAEGHVVVSVHTTLGSVIRKEREERRA